MFLIYTLDNFLLNKQTKKLIDKLKTKDSEAEVITYSWLEDDARKIIQDANTFSLFGDTKIIVIKDSYFLTEKKLENSLRQNTPELAKELIENTNNSVQLIFTLNEEKISKKLKIAKELEKKAEVISVPELNEDQIINFIIKKLEVKEKSISSNDAKYLLSLLPTDMTIISTEVNKLSNLDATNITKEIIDNNVTKYSEVDAFKISEYFMNNDDASFIKEFRNYIDLNDDLIGLIYLLSSNIAFARDCLILKKQRKSEQDIANLLGANPWRVKMLFKNIKRVDIKDLNDKILLLYKLNNSLIKGEINPGIISELELLKVMKRG